jgi:hypothetical protein
MQPAPHSLRAGETLKAALVLGLLVLATRAWIFGNPVVHIDDQFYMLVGERMRLGDLPFVDVWDRKPIGLFLIYALSGWIWPIRWWPISCSRPAACCSPA